MEWSYQEKISFKEHVQKHREHALFSEEIKKKQVGVRQYANKEVTALYMTEILGMELSGQVQERH